MDFDKYKNTLPYPSESQFRTTYWYRGGRCVCTQKPGESLAPGFDTSSCVKETAVDKDALRAARAAYGAETSRLLELFKRDMFEDLGIADNPKRDKLFSIAWDKGHSAGLSEVYNEAQDLVDLIT